MTSLHLRPVQFVDTPVGRDGEVARLAGGLLWFAAYEMIEEGSRRTIPIAEFERTLGTSNERAAVLHAAVLRPRAPLTLGERVIRLDQPQVMGILNVTPDSFSDGGKTINAEAAVAAGGAIAAEGAAIVDVGGESTRPGASVVWEGDETQRVVPVIERLVRSGTAVSIDTRKAAVMEAALAAGAGLINDVSGLSHDHRALEIVAKAGCPVVLMHSADPGGSLHDGPEMSDPLIETYDWLERRIEAAVAAGIDRARIIVDPGIGFGKKVAANLAILNGLSLFHGLGVPVLLGASRKRFIGALSNEVPADQRLGGSLAVALKAIEQGVQILRVHDVVETAQAIRVWRGLRDQALVG